MHAGKYLLIERAQLSFFAKDLEFTDIVYSVPLSMKHTRHNVILCRAPRPDLQVSGSRLEVWPCIE